jgi:hypothetical protein
MALFFSVCFFIVLSRDITQKPQISSAQTSAASHYSYFIIRIINLCMKQSPWTGKWREISCSCKFCWLYLTSQSNNGSIWRRVKFALAIVYVYSAHSMNILSIHLNKSGSLFQTTFSFVDDMMSPNHHSAHCPWHIDIYQSSLANFCFLYAQR